MNNIQIKKSNESLSQKGVTIFEIIMVLFIISMIASIGLVNYNSQQAQADIAVTKSNLETIRTAMAMYRAAEGQWPANDLSDLTDGNSPSGHVYLTVIPAEAILDDNTVSVMPMYDGGWHLSIVGGEYLIFPDLSGSDANGEPYSDY